MKKYTLTGAFIAILLLSGCRGIESDNRPLHPILNMDFQEKYQAQEMNIFFENDMAMRAPVPGTVAKGFLREDVRFYSGQTEDGNYVDRVPIPVTQALLERGRERYNIYCSVCHGQAGFGQGVIMTGDYGYTPAPTYHREALRDTADGYIYEVITNGVRNMPGYAAQVPVADRWAIVAYIRALQRSQNAQRENVPPSILSRIEQTGSANMNAARNPVPPAGGGGAGTAPPDEAAPTDEGDTGGGQGAGDTSGTDPAAAGDTTAAAGGTPAEGQPSPPPESASPAPAQDAAPEAADEPALTADTAAGTDTAADAAASADTVAGGTAGDTASTAVAEGANVTESTPSDEGGGDVAASTEDTGEEGAGGSFFGSTFFIIVLVVLPILTLLSILVIAFRKDREH